MSIIDISKPFGYSEMRRDVERLTQRFPCLQTGLFGHSVMGRELTMLRLGTGAVKVFINGAFHANEWITAPLVLRVVEQLATALAEGGMVGGMSGAELFREVTLLAAPMVNPDGVELVLKGAGGHPRAKTLLAWNEGSNDFSGWKANIRGVDLNDQFPACWEEERMRRSPQGPGPRDYTGEAPLTEPEAAAVAALTELEKFDLAIAFHTQGREIYWNYRDYEPAHSEAIAQEMGLASGYEPVKLTGSDAGYKDWFIRRFRRPGFTIEAGLGENPLGLSQLPQMIKEAEGIVHCALLASIRSN